MIFFNLKKRAIFLLSITTLSKAEVSSLLPQIPPLYRQIHCMDDGGQVLDLLLVDTDILTREIHTSRVSIGLDRLSPFGPQTVL